MFWYYILVDKEPRPVLDLIEWATWFETADRKVRQTNLPNTIYVSTIFIGLDHYFGTDKEHEPIVFETMVFGGKHDMFRERYTNWADAVEGHERCVAMVEHETIIDIIYEPLKTKDLSDKKFSEN